jgi:hypothetical protein
MSQSSAYLAYSTMYEYTTDICRINHEEACIMIARYINKWLFGRALVYVLVKIISTSRSHAFVPLYL